MTPTSLPTPQSAVESVSASSINFNATQGQANPSGQVVNIVNTGGSSLNWQASVGSSWLGVTPDKGAVVAGQSEQMTVKVNIAGLTPGSYNAQITVSATDSSGMRIQGSPQTLSVTVSVVTFARVYPCDKVVCSMLPSLAPGREGNMPVSCFPLVCRYCQKGTPASFPRLEARDIRRRRFCENTRLERRVK